MLNIILATAVMAVAFVHVPFKPAIKSVKHAGKPAVSKAHRAAVKCASPCGQPYSPSCDPNCVPACDHNCGG